MDPTALLFLTQIPPPPTRPQMVEERVALSKVGETVQRAAERAHAGYASYAAKWTSDLAEARARYSAIPIEPLNNQTSKLIDDLIADFETMAQTRAVGAAALQKRAARDIKKMREPSVAAVGRDLARKLSAIDEQIIEQLLEFALFVRAARAERTPDNVVSAALSDPAKVRAFLRQQVA